MEYIEELNFKWHDYFLFAIVLISSTTIGLYYGFCKKKDTNIKDFLLGKRDMKIFPIGISIAGSLVSALAMSGVPVEVYNYGVTFASVILTVPSVLVVIYVSIIPVFYNLRISSVYEYIELRFSTRIRKLVSFLYAINMISLLPVIMYLSAVSLELALIVACIGNDISGGFRQIVTEAYEADRFHVEFDLDVTLHDSFWMMAIGNFCYWLQNLGINQVYVQKCLTLPSLKHVKRALIVFGLASVVLYILLGYTGLIIYSAFKDCDPLTSGKIKYFDQLVAYYILTISENIPGLAGIFMAGITSAGLSTFSAGTNALSSTIFNDFIEPFLPTEISQQKIGRIIKLTATAIGIICTVLVVIVAKLGGAFVLVFSLGGITAGPMFGLFLMGMFTRKGNCKGGLMGVIGSMLIMTWITIGALYYRVNKAIVHETLKISVEGCVYPFNVTIPLNKPKFDVNFTEKPALIFRISYYYYVFIGTVLVFFIGLPVSWLTNSKDHTVKEELLSPVKLWFINKSKEKSATRPEEDSSATLLAN